MKKLLYIIIFLIFNSCLCSCKTEKPKTHKGLLKKTKKLQKKEDYKVCLDAQFCKHIPLGNYAHILKITPNLSKPKNNMAYKLLLIRDKKMYTSGSDLKRNDTIINILINKELITDLAKKNKEDSIDIDNFHLLAIKYDYHRASEIHFKVPMYSIKDSLFCEATYHFDYSSGKYRSYIHKTQKTKKEAFKAYNNFQCHSAFNENFQCN